MAAGSAKAHGSNALTCAALACKSLRPHRGPRILRLALDGALNQVRQLMAGLNEAEQRLHMADRVEASHAVA